MNKIKQYFDEQARAILERDPFLPIGDPFTIIVDTKTLVNQTKEYVGERKINNFQEKILTKLSEEHPEMFKDHDERDYSQ